MSRPAPPLPESPPARRSAPEFRPAPAPPRRRRPRARPPQVRPAKVRPAKVRPAQARPARGRKVRAKRPGWLWRYRRLWFLIGLLCLTGIAGAAWVVTRVPLPPEIPQAQSTIIFDAAGTQLAALHGSENRFPVRLEQVPQVTRDAVVAAEDRKFFSHTGIDPVGILRATWADVRRKGVRQGGSTITQQYVKNVYPQGRERSLLRKLREAVLAVKIEQKHSKQEILERYLNTVYFGRGAYGIEAAAKAYFGMNVNQLGLRESAYLAGLIRSPSASDSATDPERATTLRRFVVQAMERDRKITPEQAAEVEAMPLQSYVLPLTATATTSVTSSVKGVEYFVEYVRHELLNRYDYTLDQVLRGGLRVYTTLDPKLQNLAYDSVYTQTLDRLTDPAAALVSLDKDGHVVAMVGGRDWNQSKVNLAVGTGGGGGGRQGGSAFKPFALAASVRDGYSLESSFRGPAKITIPIGGERWEVSNFEDQSFGQIDLIDATVNSVNTVYAQLVTAIGPQKVVSMANDLGIKSKLNAVPSVALGTQNVSVLEMAGAYLTFANEGMRVEPRVVARITANDGVLLDDRPARARVLDRSQANIVNYVLREVVERGSGTGASLPAGPVCGKTGTSEDYGDAWFVGYNNRLTTAVWMGYPAGQSKPMVGVHGVEKVSGGSIPATIWKKFMSRAADVPCDHPVPDGFGRRSLSPATPYEEDDSSSKVTTPRRTTPPKVVQEETPATTAPRPVATTTAPVKTPDPVTPTPTAGSPPRFTVPTNPFRSGN